MKKLKLTTKISLAMGVLSVLLLVLAGVFFSNAQVLIRNYSELVNGIIQKEVAVLKISGLIQEILGLQARFDFTLDTEYYDDSGEAFDLLELELERLREIEVYIAERESDGNSDYLADVQRLAVRIEAFRNIGATIYEETVAKGLNQDIGLRGAFRTAASNLEEIIEANQFDALMVEFLMLRRHENDYLLRLESRYVDRNIAQVQTIRDIIEASFRSAATREAMNAELDSYQRDFAAIVAANNRLEQLYLRRGLSLDTLNEELSSEREEAVRAVAEEVPRIEGEAAAISGILLLSALIALVLALIVTLALVRTIKKSLSKALESAENLGAGDFSRQVFYDRKDEMGQIITAIDIAMENLSAVLTEARKLGDSGEAISNDLAASAEESQAAVIEIQANLQSIKGLATQLKEASTANMSSINSINESIIELNNHVEHQSSGIIETTSSIEEMIANIQNVSGISQQKATAINELLKITQENGKEIQNTNSIAEEISGLAKNIMDITSVINGIAAQTNLLAMNAAIEAAHAGEAGRGFAVVADEIRKLAESSGNNAGQINTMLKHITERIQTVAKSSHDSAVSFQRIEGEVQSFTHSFSEIVSAMNEMSIGSTQVLEASQSMKEELSVLAERARGISGETDSISASTHQMDDQVLSITNGIDEIALAIANISEGSQQVSDIAQQNSENMSGLQDKLSRFTLKHSDAAGEGDIHPPR
jgi:methyl-accepting chemotaxis protein